MLVRGKNGFSLLELQLTLGVLVAILAVGVFNMRGARSSAESRGLAQVLAEEVRVARQKAITSGSPVALAFPSNGGSTPLFRGYYRLEGEAAPVMTGRRDFSGEFPSVAGGFGAWANEATDIHRVTVAGSPFDVTAWRNPVDTSDPMLIFTPAGRVTSNGLPHFDNAYHLVVGSGLSFGSSGLPAPAGSSLTYFSLLGAQQAQTISVTFEGRVFSDSGVLGAPALDGANVAGGGFAVADLPPLNQSSSNTLPVLESIEFHPVPNLAALPDGADAVVQQEQLLTLMVTASDADGDELYIEWEGEGGAFSTAQERVRMQWNPDTRLWTTVCEWSAPEGASGSLWGLSCRLLDHRGGKSLGSVSASRVVAVAGLTQVAFAGAGSGGSDLYTVGVEGNRQREFSDSTFGGEIDPVYSPSGGYLVYGIQGSSDLFTVRSDGTQRRRISISGQRFGAPGWTSDSSHLLVTQGNPPNRVVKISVDGRSRQTLGLDPGSHGVRWCPGQERVAAIDNYPRGQAYLWIPETDTRIDLPFSGVSELLWDGFGDKLLCATAGGIFLLELDDTTHSVVSMNQVTNTLAQSLDMDQGASRACFIDGDDLFLVNTDGSGLTNLSNNSARESSCRFTPGGDLVFVSNRNGRDELFFSTPTGSRLFQLSQGFRSGHWSIR